jgi:hypothetical protein
LETQRLEIAAEIAPSWKKNKESTKTIFFDVLFRSVRAWIIFRHGPVPTSIGELFSSANEIFRLHVDIFGDLSQQDGRNIAAFMKRNGGASSIGMAKLPM